MTQKEQLIIEGLRKLGRNRTAFEIVKVLSVDKAKATCVVEIEANYQLPDVALSLAGDMLVIPKVNSLVLIAYYSDDAASAAVVMFSEVESVEFFGGSLGGMPKIETLIQKLNVIETALNSVIDLYKLHTHGVVVPENAAAAEALKLQPTQRNEIENEKIKQ